MFPHYISNEKWENPFFAAVYIISWHWLPGIDKEQKIEVKKHKQEKNVPKVKHKSLQNNHEPAPQV